MAKNQAQQCQTMVLTTDDPARSALSALADLSLSELRTAWTNTLGISPPAIRSRDFLLRAVAWQLQADALGGLDKATERKLLEVAKALERDGSYEPKIRSDLSPGVVLTREWKGVLHQVTVTKFGFD